MIPSLRTLMNRMRNKKSAVVTLLFFTLVFSMVFAGPGRAEQAVEKTFPPALAVPRLEIFPESAGGQSEVLQGRAFLVKISDPSRTLACARAKWSDQDILCFPDKDRVFWYGIGGVPRTGAPGEYELDVFMETTSGRRITARKGFMIVKAVFPKAELTVDPAMARTPPDKMPRVEEDRKAFSAAWANPSYGMYWVGGFARPLPGRITSPFGEQRIFNKEVGSVHSGVDLAAPVGEPIRSAAAGVVVLVHQAYVEGNTVVVDHGGGVFTYYCHMSEFKVEPGQVVKAGDVLGLVGLTGRITGPHLHWGVRVQGVKVDGTSLLDINQWTGAEKTP